MRNLMTSEEIKDRKDEIVAMNDSLDEQRLLMEEKRAELHSVKEEISEAQRSLDTLTNLKNETENAVRDADRKVFYLSDQIEKGKSQLASNARLQKIQDLVDEQPDFASALEKRLEKKQQEMFEEMGDFVEFAEPSKVVRRIESQRQTQSRFDDATIEMRGAKHNYDLAIYALCEKKIDGTRITPADAMSHLVRLDAFLMSNHIAGLWQLG